jgi:hypothetical protein
LHAAFEDLLDERIPDLVTGLAGAAGEGAPHPRGISSHVVFIEATEHQTRSWTELVAESHWLSPDCRQNNRFCKTRFFSFSDSKFRPGMCPVIPEDALLLISEAALLLIPGARESHWPDCRLTRLLVFSRSFLISRKPHVANAHVQVHAQAGNRSGLACRRHSQWMACLENKAAPQLSAFAYR